jgi:hypothetical protein
MITPEQLRKCAMCVYLAAEAGPAEDISRHLNEAATIIETRAEMLREAAEVVREVSEGYCSDCELNLGICIHQRATTLLPKLEAAIKG